MDVTVLGSLNVDFTAFCLEASLPRPGETVFGSMFEKSWGGKGANQAVQASRLGVKVRMIGRVGNLDNFGKEYLAHLKEEGVFCDTVDEVDGVNTGIAHITVAASGENSIVIVQGANGAVNSQYIDRHYETISLGKVLLCQNEIPFASTIAGLKAATDSGVITIFNPAPAPSAATASILESPSSPSSIANEVWQESTSNIFENLRFCGPLTYVCVNETELSALSGAQKLCETDEEIEYYSNKLMGLCYCSNVIVTLGERGCYHLSGGGVPNDMLAGLQQIRSPQKEKADGRDDRDRNIGVESNGQFYRCDSVVDAVDTTGAGDAFLGAFAAHLSQGSNIDVAIRAALHIATESVCGQGTQQSYSRAQDLHSKFRVPLS